jgi:hypothetical protein
MSKRSIVHIEIPAQGRESLAEFYHKLCGWEFEHFSEPSPYSMGETGSKSGSGSPVGVGLPDMGDTYKPGDVILYIGSEDVAADLKQIEAAGGKRLSDPFMVGEMGEMAFFTDPSGNRLALWKDLPPGN